MPRQLHAASQTLPPVRSVAARVAVMLIRGYQRWISPYMGFVCAHARLRVGPSCSEFARRAIADRGIRGALPSIARRLRECRAAAQCLRERRRVFRNGIRVPSSRSDVAPNTGARAAVPLAMARGGGTNRRLEERIAEEVEQKRKRLQEIPRDDNSWTDWLWCGCWPW